MFAKTTTPTTRRTQYVGVYTLPRRAPRRHAHLHRVELCRASCDEATTTVTRIHRRAFVALCTTAPSMAMSPSSRATLTDASRATSVYEQTFPSVVGVAKVLKSGERRVVGSGFVWAVDPNGENPAVYIACNARAVSVGSSESEGEGEAIVFETVRGKESVVLGSESAYYVNRAKDVGFVKIPLSALSEGARMSVRAASIGTSGDVRVGQSAFALGFASDGSTTLNSGVVSGLKRRIPSKSGTSLSGLIQMEASVSESTSGGPVCDSSGRVIGMSVTAYGSGRSDPAGVNFAIPIDAVRLVAEQL